MASRYGLSVFSGEELASTRGTERYTISEHAAISVSAQEVLTNCLHLPCGADILPWPVMNACTAAVVDPPSNDDGGNTKTEVSTTFCSGVDGASSACSAVSGASSAEGAGSTGVAEGYARGRSMIATHLATVWGNTGASDVGLCAAAVSSLGRWSGEERMMSAVKGSGKSSSSITYFDEGVPDVASVGGVMERTLWSRM